MEPGRKFRPLRPEGRQDMSDQTDKLKGLLRGRGRPAIGVPVQIRLTPEQLSYMDIWADETGVSRAEAVRTVVQDWIDAHKGTDGPYKVHARDLARWEAERLTGDDDVAYYALAAHYGPDHWEHWPALTPVYGESGIQLGWQLEEWNRWFDEEIERVIAERRPFMAIVPIASGPVPEEVDEESGGYWADVRTLTPDERQTLRGEATASGDKTLVELLESLD